MSGVTFWSRIKLFVGAYVTILVVAVSICLLFSSHHGHRDGTDADGPGDSSWKHGVHTNRTLIRDSDPLSLAYVGLKWTSSPSVHNDDNNGNNENNSSVNSNQHEVANSSSGTPLAEVDWKVC